MAREGYYPDPSIPGYVRYWNGLSWVPGTSRPAAVVPGARSDETGPVFLDEPEPEPVRVPERGPERRREREPVPEPAVAEQAVWQADPVHQAGFGGPRDRRVSWGNEPGREPEREPGRQPERGPGREPEREPGGAPEPVPGRSGISLARTPEPVRRMPAQASAGILSARSPAAPAPAPAAPAPAPAAPAPAPAPAPAWPEVPGAAASGLTSSWPETPAARPAAPAEAWQPRPEGARPALPHLEAPAPRAATGAATAEEPRPEARQPRAGGARPAPPRTAAAPSVRPAGQSRAEGARAVFERMAERAVRPAGLGRRAVARALDSLVYAAVAAGAAWPLLPGLTAHLEAKVDAARASGRTTTVWLLDATVAGQLALVLGAVLLFGILYEVLPTARWGRTPGKKLLGVRVLATTGLRPPRFGAALRRWLVYALLGLPGSLWCLVDRPRRQAWHDKAARTYVSR